MQWHGSQQKTAEMWFWKMVKGCHIYEKTKIKDLLVFGGLFLTSRASSLCSGQAFSTALFLHQSNTEPQDTT